MSTALRILADHQNLVGWWLIMLNYMRTPAIHYFQECSERRPTYMETLPYTAPWMCCPQSVAGSGHTKQYRCTYPAQFVVMGNTKLIDKTKAVQLMLHSLDTADGGGQGEGCVFTQKDGSCNDVPWLWRRGTRR